MRKFLVTYDIQFIPENTVKLVHTRSDTVPIKDAVKKLADILTTATSRGTADIVWGPEKEYSSNYAFIEAEDQDAAIEQFIKTYNTDRYKVVKMMISDLSHVYKVPL